ncbi:MAG: uncharacterized protein JWQ53_3046 [Klenkia sp.]|nr:uncharacterized protein [Klenkia sp.]
MTITPEVLDGELSLSAAANRLSYLTRKDSENAARSTDPATTNTASEIWQDFHATATALDTEEALELLALGEVISRKAHESDTAAVTAARLAGADWADIGAAVGLTGAEAWDAHQDDLAPDLLGDRPTS